MPSPDTKACARCKQEKPVAEFYRDRRTASGYQSYCKQCRRETRNRESQRNYYRRHRERVLADQKAYRLANPEKRREWSVRRYHEKKESEDARVRRWRAVNPERVKAYQTRNYERHRETLRARSKAYYEANRERCSASARMRQRERGHTYYIDIEKRRESVARRRAQLRGNYVERVDREKVYERDQGRCYLCNSPVPPDGWHLEHIIPISKGGAHSYSNVAVSCPPCNQRKSARLPN